MTYDKAVEYINEIPKFTKKNTPEHTKDKDAQCNLNWQQYC